MRIWVDGCFDFFHHGHAGALNQARELGNALFVGVHTDKDILQHKGPVVMHLDERVYAVETCRWTSETVPGAPYVTDPKVMDEYGCEYVAHGDDITTDAEGNDCYQEVKDLGRFLEFKRTPNISTTDLIARMLSNSTSHHSEASQEFLASDDAQQRFSMYARAPSAREPYAAVYNISNHRIVEFVQPAWHEVDSTVVSEVSTDVVYVDGAFDLFHCGHIEFLERVKKDMAGSTPVIVGLRADKVVNEQRGGSSPIMNIFERALCVLQCRYVDGVVLNVGYDDPRDLLRSVRLNVVRVARGPTGRVVEWAEPLLVRVDGGKYALLRTQTIVERVLTNRAQYDERQRKKGIKAIHENEMR